MIADMLSSPNMVFMSFAFSSGVPAEYPLTLSAFFCGNHIESHIIQDPDPAVEPGKQFICVDGCRRRHYTYAVTALQSGRQIHVRSIANELNIFCMMGVCTASIRRGSQGASDMWRQNTGIGKERP